MASPVSPLIALVRRICLNEEDIEISQKRIEETVSSIQQRSPVERFEIIAQIDGILQSKGSNKQVVATFKHALKEINLAESWRSALLNPFFKRKIKVVFPFQSYDNNLEKPLTYEERVQTFQDEEMTALFGSTFATNKPHRLNLSGDHLLDSAHAGICLSRDRSFQGYALAIGDGSGGHFGDSSQDKRIAKVSHLATKWSVEIFSSYTDPNELTKAIPSIVSVLDTTIQNRIWGEGTTLLCCRVFLAEKGYRVVGFNIGDTMLCYWDITKRKLKTLAPARVSEAGTAIFPSAYRSEEIIVFDEHLPCDSTILLMTDGVHDTLSYKEKGGEYSNGLRFRRRKLSGHNHDLKSCGEALKEIPLLLMKKSMNSAENLRKSNLQNKDVQIGDDGAILGCRLRKT